MENRILDISGLYLSFSNTKATHNKNILTEEQKHVLQDVSLSLPQKKITALIGGNGSGKTTLFNLISGLLKPQSGTITFDNKYNLVDYSPYKIPRLGIGRLFQDVQIFPNLTVLDNMCIAVNDPMSESILSIFPFFYTGKLENARKEKAFSIFERFLGTNNFFCNNPVLLAGKLSYGQQRLLGLFRMFMNDYKLLLLDEPTAGVNSEIVVTIGEILREAKKDDSLTIFLIEHDIEFVQSLADYSIFLNNGKVQFFAETEEVLSKEVVKYMYIGQYS